MNNENQDQNTKKNVPNDLLVLVSRPESPDNSKSLSKSNSENNIFIKDSPIISENKTAQNSGVNNEKLNALLGFTSISNADTLISNSETEKVNTKVDVDDTLKSEQLINNQNILTPNKSTSSGMDVDTLMKNTYNYKIELERKTVRSNKLFFIATIISGIGLIIILMFAIFSGGINVSFRGKEAYYQNKNIEDLGEFQTVVVTDNLYTNVVVNNESDAQNLIIKDSNNQKDKCDNIKVKEIETRIEEKYDIVAVNLCEVDYEFAYEIEKVIDNVYKEFPDTIKGYLTNLTLDNMEVDGPFASFLSVKLFAKSNTINTFPNVYKTSIFLNAYYFLNLDLFSTEVEQAEGSWFVKNATKSSLVAHEFGHYLSFIAQLNNTNNIDSVLMLTRKNYKNYYKLVNDSNEGVFAKKIIEEAYENINSKNPEQFDDLDEFRGSISRYALETDVEGDPIYDETIAEAFHDWYLNKQKAAVASKEIVNVLKKYINN